ncbi:unnamed protein product [Amoebophrya sp. A25]|nr:unnamed protein product [Amoebophrya sp. A25]|eukprot:GSA25T00005252001.1
MPAVVATGSSATSSSGRQPSSASCVKVGVRLKPTEEKPLVHVGSRTCVRVESPASQHLKDYVFDRVFDASVVNDEVAEGFVGELIPYVRRGESGAVLCYGQTGSGKTHTMGLNNSVASGIVPYCLRQLLPSSNGAVQSAGTAGGAGVRLEFLQVYLDQVYDLFCVGKKLQLREVPGLGVMVEGSTLVEVDSFDDATEIIDLALRNRCVGEVHLRTGVAALANAEEALERRRSTGRNSVAELLPEDLAMLGLSKHMSSRSHVLLTLHVRNQNASSGGRNECSAGGGSEGLPSSRKGSPNAPPSKQLTFQPAGGRSDGSASSSAANFLERSNSVATSETSRRAQDLASASAWARLVLVDLAGSERSNVGVELPDASRDSTSLGSGSTVAGGGTGSSSSKKMMEAKSINASLAALGNVVNSLSKITSTSNASSVFVPWRDSKLTKLLWDALKAPSRVKVLCTVAREQRSVSETVSTLAFATRCKKITARPQRSDSYHSLHGGVSAGNGAGGRNGQEVTLLRAEVLKLRQEKQQLEKIVQTFQQLNPAGVEDQDQQLEEPGPSAVSASDRRVRKTSARSSRATSTEVSFHESSAADPDARKRDVLLKDGRIRPFAATNVQPANHAANIQRSSSLEDEPTRFLHPSPVASPTTQSLDPQLYLTSPPSPSRGLVANREKGVSDGPPAEPRTFLSQFLEAVEQATGPDPSPNAPLVPAPAGCEELSAKAQQVLDEVRGLKQYAAWQKNLSEDLMRHCALAKMDVAASSRMSTPSVFHHSSPRPHWHGFQHHSTNPVPGTSAFPSSASSSSLVQPVRGSSASSNAGGTAAPVPYVLGASTASSSWVPSNDVRAEHAQPQLLQPIPRQPRRASAPKVGVGTPGTSGGAQTSSSSSTAASDDQVSSTQFLDGNRQLLERATGASSIARASSWALISPRKRTVLATPPTVMKYNASASSELLQTTGIASATIGDQQTSVGDGVPAERGFTSEARKGADTGGSSSRNPSLLPLGASHLTSSKSKARGSLPAFSGSGATSSAKDGTAAGTGVSSSSASEDAGRQTSRGASQNFQSGSNGAAIEGDPELLEMRKQIDAVLENRNLKSRTQFTPYSANPTPNPTPDLSKEAPDVDRGGVSTSLHSIDGNEQQNSDEQGGRRGEGRRGDSRSSPRRTEKTETAADGKGRAVVPGGEARSPVSLTQQPRRRSTRDKINQGTKDQGASNKSTASVGDGSSTAPGPPEAATGESVSNAKPATRRALPSLDLLHAMLTASPAVAPLTVSSRASTRKSMSGSSSIGAAMGQVHSMRKNASTSNGAEEASSRSPGGRSASQKAGAAMADGLMRHTLSFAPAERQTRSSRPRAPLPRLKLDLEETTKRMRSASRGRVRGPDVLVDTQ